MSVINHRVMKSHQTCGNIY